MNEWMSAFILVNFSAFHEIFVFLLSNLFFYFDSFLHIPPVSTSNRSSLVYHWFVTGSSLDNDWSLTGSSLENDWSITGLWLVHRWFMIGLWLVHPWIMIGLWSLAPDSWSWSVSTLSQQPVRPHVSFSLHLDLSSQLQLEAAELLQDLTSRLRHMNLQRCGDKEQDSSEQHVLFQSGPHRLNFSVNTCFFCTKWTNHVRAMNK